MKRETRLVALVYLVCLVCLVEIDEPDQLVPPVSYVSRFMHYGLWRLAPVTRFSAGFFSPLTALYRRRFRAPSPNILFVRMFHRAHFHACLASHSQRVPADGSPGDWLRRLRQCLSRCSSDGDRRQKEGRQSPTVCRRAERRDCPSQPRIRACSRNVMNNTG